MLSKHPKSKQAADRQAGTQQGVLFNPLADISSKHPKSQQAACKQAGTQQGVLFNPFPDMLSKRPRVNRLPADRQAPDKECYSIFIPTYNLLAGSLSTFRVFAQHVGKGIE